MNEEIILTALSWHIKEYLEQFIRVEGIKDIRQFGDRERKIFISVIYYILRKNVNYTGKIEIELDNEREIELRRKEKWGVIVEKRYYPFAKIIIKLGKYKRECDVKDVWDKIFYK